ncbi:predicted protein [Nematostella vectensis]|uniref:U1 small nuclear ribonucleoprotein C n=1 Tax=Nematostella vectensis TaxID=45351 RepID=RU1C_NEMVE|nr:U1 small nuclear ribonucleoprotein C [Nematostella vectensis]A7SEP9.1 RecName: Full=U1 small nuclear ribonucleoprotein C; Short=U1 snRNP C; Short=U1-C; Short=U1C [Nematostella vectensis]EDO37851.1 predicted protein [Nematostella vectensis]|eukprot:XP_001629914.1 predicted protein [Nematostella vectensis]
MPKYYCDYCDTFLTHDSPSVRKTHNNGRKHKENVRFYYQKWMEEQAQTLIDQTTAAFQSKPNSQMPPNAPPGLMPPPGMLPPPGGMPPGRMPPQGLPFPPPGPIPPPPGAGGMRPPHGQMHMGGPRPQMGRPPMSLRS